MKAFIKTFILHGLVAAGFGPLILVSIYYGYQLAGKITSPSISELNGNIISALLLAFIAGGISAIFKVEKLPLGIATLIDAIVLYVDYLFFYLINDWIEKQPIPLLIFTVIFIIGYLIIWAIIYKQVKRQVQKINQKL
ncbi:DUF3021 domain-containing protein [Lactobacillus kefiranofaciens]|uniref:DUF3021 domain-containing protein n=1 Tax=Lactobacillus kefiranofaciens TaxID=267818 RepID=A0AAX3UFF2_9LACO|nr:DUF3021 domain-containing protein [Lactobacillus kefiranofaciens]AEG40251.1 Hypothetical protein WANG_0556 [Lactobacillus kefiranofaciens subsp. kefiranofaciens]KRM21830.1 hypothetical protein FC93_GL000250 [Lactobacillus kefiranofaciens subsp. kefiranofaciens DSM 5016 = JCM 6985]QFQ67818.1 DUF3021 domain-containing protein [Lactobacillus kefiranofaciens subsp. kefiranofaciens]WGO86423.1 DUF3021 domain-containing protein [Lactobacillus kefiranofaciens]WQH36254.1 DUF3021 domain-containing pr